jgi:hypothetical protein
MKMVSKYITRVGKQAAQHQLSIDLEEEMRPRLEAQPEEMKAEVEKLREAF